jgi:hypothetical protein
MDNFKQYLITELDARTAAELRVGQFGDKSERMADARMSDQRLIQKRADDIRDQQQSTDPIDRQIAQLQRRIDQLLQKKKQQGEQG